GLAGTADSVAGKSEVSERRLKTWLIPSSSSSPGITINAVRTKNKAQFPSSISTIWPLNDDKLVRPKLPRDASSAYCDAEKACPPNQLIKDTKATDEKAAVKLSTRIVAINNDSLGPTTAIQANIKLLADIAIPPTSKPRT